MLILDLLIAFYKIIQYYIQIGNKDEQCMLPNSEKLETYYYAQKEN